MTRLEDLQAAAAVRGILPDALVTVVSVTWHGNAALTVVYRDATGGVADQVLYREDEARLEVLPRQYSVTTGPSDEVADDSSEPPEFVSSPGLFKAFDAFQRRYVGPNGITMGDAEMVPRLVRILERGEEVVVRNHDFIMKHSLYADGMFWFEAFAVAYQVCCCIEREIAARYIRTSDAERLVLVLARMTACRAHGGPDIIIRGDGALSAALRLFASNTLVERLWHLPSAMDPVAREELAGALRVLQYRTA